MKLALVNPMDDCYAQYSNKLISQPPLCLGVLYTLTPKTIHVSVIDEQVEQLRYDADVIAFSVTTQLARKTYAEADKLRAQGKKVILGGYHVSICPDEAALHA
ncbi:B12-binding domain-containing radical SAM protein, partial [Candidatus Magnetobacterium casensis]|nr:B12-binding domain-containing radical SAM protein [Candidatus Magnetobacterium casensis]